MLRLAILMVSKGIPVGNARNASLYNRLLLTFMDLTVKTFYNLQSFLTEWRMETSL